MIVTGHIERVGCRRTNAAAPHGVGVAPARPRAIQTHVRPQTQLAAANNNRASRTPPPEDNTHETKLGPNVLASVKDLKEGGVKWGAATVVRNDSANLDGSVRVLHLSVSDHVDMLYGRRVKGVPDATRWIESYTIPGQCVGVRLPAPGQEPHDPPRQLYAIASSPYASRRDSAYVDASLIEVVVERHGSSDDSVLAELGPGSQLEVTQVIGRGFCSLLDSYNGLTHALEDGRNLVVIAMGDRGMAAARSALNWQPVLAHASSHSVAALYLAHSAGRASFVTDWDMWREAGMRLRPVYTHPGAGVDDLAVVGPPAASAAAGNGGASPAPAPASSPPHHPDAVALDPARSMELLQLSLFMGEGGFEGVCGGPAHRTTFLLAGLPGDMASTLTRQLAAKGVPSSSVLFAQSDFF
ncbi:hypothetical protein HYH03_012992 [Edaphochlamys debaryana]|uniref:FAD-binding FR-type domain-containing protein n=1 Tax=Edaphochlamys debaryana TaxID=47281 RepID=A0A836BUY6_9CHLO|nr:hypothetical protein HYH03_012992 [Edaphochlamys debaryana]|eukprot:KAG2488488.1 hypothetical protein HYH03_012992 [Edaphochlamys debaryana]